MSDAGTQSGLARSKGSKLEADARANFGADLYPPLDIRAVYYQKVLSMETLTLTRLPYYLRPL
jgi:hypothetical protein